MVLRKLYMDVQETSAYTTRLNTRLCGHSNITDCWTYHFKTRLFSAVYCCPSTFNHVDRLLNCLTADPCDRVFKRFLLNVYPSHLLISVSSAQTVLRGQRSSSSASYHLTEWLMSLYSSVCVHFHRSLPPSSLPISHFLPSTLPRSPVPPSAPPRDRKSVV